MARVARVVWPGCPYHVTHRGNRGDPVFFNRNERRRYLQMLYEDGRRWGLRVWGYALMTNHVHLVVVPESQDSLARTIGNVHRRHACCVNLRAGWTGHLWANRFFSTPLDDEHLWAAARYVELNPVRARIVSRAEDYPWSSARAHVYGSGDPLLDVNRPFPGNIPDWGTWLHEGVRDSRTRAIRENTRTGRPTGSDAFVSELERRLGRELRPGKPGRKRKIR